jgi:Carboxypeptidase regulatory-like domain
MKKEKLISILQIFLLVPILSGLAPSLFAQAGRGGLSGLVSDATGAIVPGATVTALNTATGTKQTTVSTGAGLYSFVSLAPGAYDVSASAPGFDTVVQKHVMVTLDQVTTVNIALKVGSVNEVVTVTGTTELVDTSNSTVGQLINSETIDRVPLLTRNVYDLVQLSAGVTPANGAPNSSSSQQITSISSGRPGIDVSAYTFNGAIVGSVYYMVDGSPLGIAENNAGAIMPALDLPEDAVEETRVETQNTPASYLSGGAGVISLASKSGGEKFHGSAFGVFRPNIMAANEFFNKQAGEPTPDFHRYQEGGSIGGPVMHGKLFFFADYEATQQQSYDGSNWFTVPTTAERTGDFSADPFTIYDPTRPDNPDGTRQPFPGNKITNPNPTALAFLANFPKCNIPSPDSCDAQGGVINNYFAPGTDPFDAQRFDIRVDWLQSEKQRIFGRFSFDRLFTAGVNAFNNMWDLYYAQNITNGRNILVADDLTLNPTTVLQLRYSFTRHYENQSGDPRQNGYDITKLGFPAELAAEQTYKTLPIIEFWDVGGGIGGTANWNTFQYASENSDANASITKSWGKHELSAGFEWMKRFLNVGQPPASSGDYAFDISATDRLVSPPDGSDIPNGGSDFASFMVGMGSTPGSEGYNFTKDLFVAGANPYYATFFEDTWRPNQALTVTAGLRWDIFGGRTERHNRLAYFEPSATNTVSGVQYKGAELYVNGDNRSPFERNLGDFGPRAGIAWQAMKRLVVRAGGGFYYGPSAQMVGGASQNSDGFSSVTNWAATCYNADGNTVFNGSAACGTNESSGVGVYTGPYAVNNPFPNGVVPVFTTAPSGLGNNLGQTLNTMLHTQRTVTTYNYNFGLEYEFPHQFVLSAAYVGSRGLFLPLGGADLNMLDLATIRNHGASLCVDTSDNSCQMVPNQWAAILPPTNANYGADMVPLWASLQEYPQFGNGSYGNGNGINISGYPGGDSHYNSLQTKLQKRLTNHFTLLTSFTWAKLMTDDGNPPLSFVGSHNGAPQDWKNLSLEHAVSPQDVKYQFTSTASYDLPVGKGRAVDLGGVGNGILGGWTGNFILYLSTGIPIASPGSGVSPSYFNQRADMTCDPGHGAPHSQTRWFRADCFELPSSPLVAGTAPAYLDHVRTMGAQNVDMSLYKNFSFGESKDLRFEIASYNVTNHAQLGMPNVPNITAVNTQQDSATAFGQITSTVNSPRQFQFTARFTF